MNALRTLLKLLVASLVMVLTLTAALWLWSGSDSSLATLLARVPRFLPAGQTLEAREVQGALRTGGHIGWLRWQRGSLSVEARDIGVAWTLGPLFGKQLRLSELSVASLSIENQRGSDSVGQRAPPTDLRLPITVDVPFKFGNISWTGATPQATSVSGHYRFDGQNHTLDNGQAMISAGDYRISGQLQATAPMTLAIQVDGTVRTPLPSSQQQWQVAATARLTGELAGPDAALALQASLTPTPATSLANQPGRQAVMQAEVSARIAPWQAQPLSQAQGRWQNLSLAALWPRAPQTQLSGEASVTPRGTAWQGQIRLANARPGPWNQQNLPLDRLQAVVRYDHGQWALQSVLATGAGGSLTGSGQIEAGQWQGQVSVLGLNPGAVDTRLAQAAMSGKLQAKQTTGGITFEAQLAAATDQGKAGKSSQTPASLHTLRLQNLQAKGVWASPQLRLSALSIDAQDAHLEGSLVYQLNSQAAQGKLAVSLPGLQGDLDGHLASQDGQGTLSLKVTDASLASQWLQRWPSMAGALQGLQFKGAAQLQGSWSGGWQQQGRNLQVSTSLRAPQLAWRSSPANRTSLPAEGQLLGLEADLSGALPALTFSTKGRADIGARQLDWQAQASAGQLEVGHWQGSLGQFKLTAHDSGQPGSWTLQTDASQAVVLDWKADQLDHTLTMSAGNARLEGPQPGTAKLSWQTLRWSQALAQNTTPVEAKAQWQSRGQISNLPLAWLDTLSGKTMAELGLSSDLILAGHWDARQTDTVHINAMLERSSGDLRLHTDENRPDNLPADMREARLELNLDAGFLSSSLRWDSARAGKALVAFSTQLQPQGEGWNLDKKTPIGGSLQIQLPPVDAWSVLAPPGWRLRGTMDANIALTGTLEQPQWDGQLQARDLAVRSVADGIDFSQGKLNARLHGQQVDIQEFSLQGATTPAGGGGLLTLSGSVLWLPGDSGANFLTRLSMALDAQAKALRLSSRSDRRVLMSGQIAARLKDARLSLRGNLSADQALITLPDDSAPQLGDDVVVRRPVLKSATATAPPRKAGVTNTSGPRLTSDLLIELDLGPDFQVRGRGLETRLAGKLALQALDREVPRLTGSVSTVRGTYRAYGQRLDIEQGIVRFAGAVDNPALNILAIRPNLNQRVGVQVIGTALSPIVRLYAEPDLPDAEKLAWLVLGRSASGSGGEAALLQQAALALLGGTGQGPSTSLTQALGLDELSFGNSRNDTTSGAMVTIGKRLSNDFYVAYESSLAGSMGVFTIFYDLSRRLTLRARTGEQSAVDVIWTLRYD